MWNSYKAIDIMYTILQPVLSTVIAGDVYKVKRANAEGEDVTINCLVINTDIKPQRAVLNINVFVPNIKTEHGDMPALSRLQTLTALIITTLNNYVNNDYLVVPTNSYTGYDVQTGEQYSNIKVELTNYLNN